MEDNLRTECDNLRHVASIQLMELTKLAFDKKIKLLNNTISNIELEVDRKTVIQTNTWADKERLKLKKTKENKLRKLGNQVDNELFEEIQVAGDGNCFYGCLSVYLFETEDNHAGIRERLCDFIWKYKSRFECFVDEPIEEHIRKQRMVQGSIDSWATEAEIHAASALYGVDIHVKIGNNGNFNAHTFRLVKEMDTFNSMPHGRTIYMKLKDDHFTLLRPVSFSNIGDNEVVDKTRSDWFDLHEENENDLIHCFPRSSNNLSSHIQIENPGGSRKKQRNERSDEAKHKYNKIKNDQKKLGMKEKNSLNNNGARVDTITNLSKYKLTDDQINLLSKGLKFIPDRTKVDKIKLLADLAEWERRMRLREYFHKEDSDDQVEKEDENPEDRFVVKKSSTFTPNKGRDMWLDMYIEMVKTDIVNNLKNAKKLNLTTTEHAAFLSLLHNEEIVIRPADKGSGIVVLDKTDYIAKLEEEMEKSESYVETEGDLTQVTMKKVKKLVNKMYREGVITKNMQHYLTSTHSKAGSLKGNPKLHKTNYPFRTIVNGINTPTEKLAEVAEFELEEYVVTSPSYIRDTTDFINKLKEIKEPVPNGSYLFCFDVSKLYPSVPKKEGMKACHDALESRSSPIIPTQYVLDMIETVLENNNFNLGKHHYLQTEGIAIGSKLGRNFACTYMRQWDEKLLESTMKPLFYKRFIDDGFGIWTGNLESLKEFAQYANHIHEKIKIELRYSQEKIEFLDTWVKLEKGHIYTDLYRKPTDKQLYLQQKSCHPPHTKKGLVYGLGLRLRRICEREEDYNKHRTELKMQLRKRGYAGRLIETQLQRVDHKKREELLVMKNKSSNLKRVPLVLTFSKLLPDIRGILQKHSRVLYRSDRMRQVFEQLPILSYRRDKNIADTLVHKKTAKAINPRKEKSPCCCKVCQSVHDHYIRSTDGKETFQPIYNAGCDTRNVVYALICAPCDKTIYVGETERSVKERISEHMRDVRNQAEKPIMRHFSGHSVEDVKFVVLQCVGSEGKAYRQLVEDKWIIKLGTKFPFGCNVQTGVSYL